jgi:hypothetical protein
MNLPNGLKVSRTINPHPAKWPGPWFRFETKETYTDTWGREKPVRSGSAHHKALHSYIGDAKAEEVFRHYAKTMKGA